MPRLSVAALAMSTALGALVLAGPAAEAASHVGAGQAFVGRVNGTFSDATVTVICPGPAGQKGHPAAGQRLEVLSPPPPVAVGVKVSVGQTGSAGRAIVARFSDDPSVTTTLRQYFTDMPIPTSLSLPCAGSGNVVFRPVPNSGSARPSVVSVHFVNPAVSAVRGTVAFSPTCPVERVPPDPACAPKPGAAHIQLLRADGTVAAEGDAGSDGQFLIDVAPGSYSVRATPPTPLTIGRGCTADPAQLTVTQGAVNSTAVSCDTGIR